MKMIPYKRIIGVFVLLLLMISYYDVNAEDNVKIIAGSAEAACTNLTKTDFEEKYGIEFDYKYDKNDNPSYMIIKMNSKVMAKSVKSLKPKFKLKALYGFVNGGERLLDYKAFLKSSSDILSTSNSIKLELFKDYNFTGVKVEFEPVGFNDPDVYTKCGVSSTFYLYTTLDNYRPPVIDTVGIPPLPEVVKTTGIDCTSYTTKYSTGSFEYKFCDMKDRYSKAPEDEKKSYTFTTGKDKFSKLGVTTPNFSCDPYKLVIGTPKDDNEYYVNKSYLYGVGDFVVGDGKYVYHYGCETKEEVATCNVKCEEIVEVEYGAPVASKAGFCFEYKVKVTSRVDCGIVGEIPKPRESKICTPSPVCKHPGGGTYKQGGPDEDFDSCVASCDGGVYSDKCSDKCYKEVYGESIVRGTSADEISYADKLDSNDSDYSVNKVAQTGTKKGYVCKVTETSKSISWTGGGKARWYNNHSWGIGNKAEYTVIKNGIPRRQNCKDNCYWVGCKGDVYLNPGDNEEDEKHNVEVYNNLKKQCESYVKCNTTTGEFTISVSYLEKGKAEDTWINFPYSRSKDELVFKGDGTKKATDTTILDSDGCYDSNEDTKWYMGEWSFPGTWHNGKSGEISFKEITGSAWTKTDKKFCIPRDFPNVNEKWWLYYYTKLHGNDDSYAANSNYSTTENIGEGCNKMCNYTSKFGTFTKEDEKNIKYNIKATTRKFGLFEWNIDISCFYALSELPNTTYDQSCSNNKCGCVDGDCKSEYKVRSINLENMFPSKDGSTKSDMVPFNWSKYATNKLKDPDYTSAPSEYKKWVEEKGYRVYDDEYLDYEVNLTRSTIKKLRAQNKQFGNFNDGNVEFSSVANYLSPLFRNGGLLSGDSHYPTKEALKCNNMHNYRSNTCDEF